ncbi:MAG TPA: RES family NAD+ phosphorylase [Fibrella sp.]
MRVYRILKTPYNTDPLTVVGSEISPGRWNQKGQGLLYTASHPALALVETMAHFEDKPLHKLPELKLFELEVDEALIGTIHPAALPRGWNGLGTLTLTQPFLDEWIENPDNSGFSYLGVSVPSAILEMSVNYLFAPKHPVFSSIRLIKSWPLLLDHRIWRL